MTKMKNSEADRAVVEVIKNYGWGAMGTMVAIPVPGADIAATTAVWAKMIIEIAGAYGYEVAPKDAQRLASDLFKSVILTTAVWFASAKTASFLLKFVPGAGTITAYAIDALVAGVGAKGITARLGTAAALYYKSGKRLAPRTIAEHVRNVAGDPRTILKALSFIATGETLDGVDDIADFSDDA